LGASREGKKQVDINTWRKIEHAQAQVMEYYHRDLAFHLAELTVFVVNDLTVADQKFIDLLTKRAETSGENKVLVVVHNFKEVSTLEDLREVWKVTTIPCFLALSSLTLLSISPSRFYFFELLLICFLL